MLGIANALSLGMGGGGAAAFNPSDYGTVAWWLRGDDVTLNGADVASWNDKSGNARHWTQGTPGKQPLFVASAINGKPGLQFDAASQEHLRGPNFFGVFTAAETFIVLQRTADPPVSATTDGLWKIGQGTSSVVPFTDGKIYDSFASTVRKTTVNPAASMASPCVYNVVSTSSEWTNFLNGTQLYTTATNTVAFYNSPAALGWDIVSTIYMDGIICEWLTFSAKLDAAGKAAVKAYLGTRYGITMA